MKRFKIFVKRPCFSKRGYWCKTVYECVNKEDLLEGLTIQDNETWQELLKGTGEAIPETFYKAKEVPWNNNEQALKLTLIRE